MTTDPTAKIEHVPPDPHQRRSKPVEPEECKVVEQGDLPQYEEQWDGGAY